MWVAGAVGSGDDDDDDLELSALWGTAPGRGGWSEGSGGARLAPRGAGVHELPEGCVGSRTDAVTDERVEVVG